MLFVNKPMFWNVAKQPDSDSKKFTLIKQLCIALNNGNTKKIQIPIAIVLYINIFQNNEKFAIESFIELLNFIKILNLVFLLGNISFKTNLFLDKLSYISCKYNI